MPGIGQTIAKMATPAGLVLYYHPYSFYSQKVVMAMNEKKLQYEPVIINITKGEQYSSSFLKINPRGEVPVLQDNGKIIPDSARIIDYLEDNFSNENPHLLPSKKDSEVRKKVEHFRQIIDALPAGIITMGSFFHTELCKNPKMPFILPIRKMLKSAEIDSSKNLRINAELNPEAKDVLIKKADFQDKKHKIVMEKDEYMKVLKSVEDALESVEKELLSHKTDDGIKWLCSNDFTIADISLTILLVRLDTLGLSEYLWANGKRQQIELYYKRVQTNQSFKDSIPDLSFHLKLLINSQSPMMLGVGIATAVGIIAGLAIIMKRIVI